MDEARFPEELLPQWGPKYETSQVRAGDDSGRIFQRGKSAGESLGGEQRPCPGREPHFRCCGRVPVGAGGPWVGLWQRGGVSDTEPQPR